MLRSARSNFCATFAGFCSIMFTQVLMKELERILVRKTFNCRVSFKILLSMCLIIVEKELWTSLWSSNFQNSIFGKTSTTVWKSFLSKCPLFSLVLNKKIKINTRNTIQKSRLLQKHCRPIFLSFGSWNLVLYLRVWVKIKFFFWYL